MRRMLERGARRATGLALLLGLFLGLVAATAVPAGAADWHFEELDGWGGPNGRVTADAGSFSSPILYGGTAHVFYRMCLPGSGDCSDAWLRHTWWNGAAWQFETLDGGGGPNGRTFNDVGRNVSTLVMGGQLHVFYGDQSAGDLRHGWWNGIAWQFETLDGAGGPNGRTFNSVDRCANPEISPYDPNSEGDQPCITSLMFGPHPHLFYADRTDGNLRHAWWNGAAWMFETLDGMQNDANGRVFAYVGLSVAAGIYGGAPHIYYVDHSSGNLRHGWWTGATWRFETLDGAGGGNGRIDARVGEFPTTVLYQSFPHVFYADRTNGDLRHGWWNGGGWAFETLDGAGGANGRTGNWVGRFNTASLFAGGPHVYYRDETFDDMRHGWWNGFGWTFETLDGAGGANGRTFDDVFVTGGGGNSITLLGGPHIFYWDLTRESLRHAWYG